ncbi:MAG: site-specific DNA-methyltransferase [Alicyclobacillus sp.]|nr:site-specific DNA-methyltransferase [Alicyclobacillus sp.]
MPSIADLSDFPVDGDPEACGSGRPADPHVPSPDDAPRDHVDTRNKLNELSGKRWVQETKSVWFQRGLGSGHAHAWYERQHPAPFSYQDVRRLIEFFTKTGQVVLDPFAGVASTLKACALSGRVGIGIELSPVWMDLARERLSCEVGPEALETQRLITGDARVMLRELADASVDFVVTSPPYWNILTKPADHKVKQRRLSGALATRYSESDQDLGNIREYGQFLDELTGVFSECYRILRPGKYMAVVVSDFRHRNRFVPYHADLARKLTEPSLRLPDAFELQGIKILVQNHKPLYPYGYPFAYVENIHHQYILIFRRPRRSGTRAGARRAGSEGRAGERSLLEVEVPVQPDVRGG